MRTNRTLVGLLVITWIGLASVAAPDAARAEDNEERGVLSYGLDGLWTGAQLGLAAGYLSTGPKFHSDEWRKLAIGSAIGLLTGTGVGIVLGVVDHASDPPPAGWYMLRDAGYGTWLGALVGTAIGALTLFDDDGRAKNLLIGASWGAIIGAGAGVGFGIFEAATYEGPGERATHGEMLRLAILPRGFTDAPLLGLDGRF